jgi:nifR3 family TIM-barrel protein
MKKVSKSGQKTRQNRRNFWNNLPRPFYALAPMANVTDAVFRKIIAKYGKPDVTWTEFVSADGLVSPGRKNLLHDLEFSPKERPIVAQVFGGHPEAMKKAAAFIEKLGFDGVDINMGCPDRSVEKQGGGAAMIKNPKIALEVLAAARAGSKNIPVSVKTRIGYNKIDLEWIKLLLEQKLPVLTVHLRTRKEMSEAPAHWEVMPQIVRLRDQISPETLIIGNGDVMNTEQGIEYAKKYACDGIMVGRGIFGKPWLFNLALDQEESTFTTEFRLKVLLEHTRLFEKTFRPVPNSRTSPRNTKSFDLMKKHFKAYVSGWDGAKELRIKLMEARTSKEVEKIIKEYLKKLST